jgi:hypothetical protein
MKIKKKMSAASSSSTPEVTVDTYTESPEMHESARARAAANISSTNVPDINLSKEEITSFGMYKDEEGNEITGELEYAVLTFLTPAFGHVLTRGSFGFKIYSAHVTLEDAQRTAERLKEYHKELYGSAIYSILVVEMGKFCEIPTTREDLNRLIKDRRHDDESLNEMIKNYRIEQEKARVMFNDRKDTLVGAGKKFSAIEKARQLRAEAVDASSSTTSTTGMSQQLNTAEEAYEFMTSSKADDLRE